MIRTIITPTDTNVNLPIEKEYVGKTLEITYLALEELEHKPSTPQKTMGDFWNVISDDTTRELHDNVQKMRGEWEKDI